MEQFNESLSSGENLELIQRDIEEGKRINVTGTPSIFLNGKRVDNRNWSRLPQLLQQKTVTIAKLMELAPLGTVNPSSTLYNSTMYLMAALLVIALVANLCIRPVDPKHHLADDES